MMMIIIIIIIGRGAGEVAMHLISSSTSSWISSWRRCNTWIEWLSLFQWVGIARNENHKIVCRNCLIWGTYGSYDDQNVAIPSPNDFGLAMHQVQTDLPRYHRNGCWNMSFCCQISAIITGGALICKYYVLNQKPVKHETNFTCNAEWEVHKLPIISGLCTEREEMHRMMVDENIPILLSDFWIAAVLTEDVSTIKTV